jgi:hypothetical protein
MRIFNAATRLHYFISAALITAIRYFDAPPFRPLARADAIDAASHRLLPGTLKVCARQEILCRYRRGDRRLTRSVSLPGDWVKICIIVVSLKVLRFVTVFLLFLRIIFIIFSAISERCKCFGTLYYFFNIFNIFILQYFNISLFSIISRHFRYFI